MSDILDVNKWSEHTKQKIRKQLDLQENYEKKLEELQEKVYCSKCIFCYHDYQYGTNECSHRFNNILKNDYNSLKKEFPNCSEKNADNDCVLFEQKRKLGGKILFNRRVFWSVMGALFPLVFLFLIIAVLCRELQN